MGNDRPLRWLLAGAAGGLAGFALPPLGLPPLLWPSLALLWSLAESPTPAASLAWGLAAVLVSHRWLLWLHPLDWIGVPAPLSLPLCLLLWLLCGVLGGALVALWVALVRRLDAARPGTALLGAGLWGLAEVLLARGPLFWLGLGASALPSDPSLAGLAALGGAGWVAALQLLIGWLLWRAVAQPLQWRQRLAGLAVVLVGAHLLGGVSLAAAAAAPEGAPERLLVLQPAIPTRRKFQPAEQLRLLEEVAAAQRRADGNGAPGHPVASVLLPEGALALAQPLPRSGGVEVLGGGFRLEGEELRSSLLRFPPGERLPAGWVDKHRVVPLGEWVPFSSLLRWGGLSAVGGIQAGTASRLLERPAGAIGVAICYELSDGAALAEATRAGARWLLASANLDPYPPMLQRQFAALAGLRAIETGRWLVSAANTGPSLVVDPSGHPRSELPLHWAGSALVSVRQRSGLTPYDRWGELPLLLLVLAGAGLRLRARRAPRGPTG